MRINAKDVGAGVLLIAIAAAGYYLNQEYTLGSARRMGPGYMPWLVFLLQMGLGALIIGLGLFNGPDRLERWAWRELVLVLAAMIVFALTLERGGLFVAVGAAVLISALGDHTHRPKGVIGLMLFLIALTWWIFIRELDIRVSIWPQFMI